MSFFGERAGDSDLGRDPEEIYNELQEVVAAMQQRGCAHPLHKH